MLGDTGATIMTKIQLELLPWVLTSLLPRLYIKKSVKTYYPGCYLMPLSQIPKKGYTRK